MLNLNEKKMITRELLEQYLDTKASFRSKDIDHDFKSISLLRERIPYEECKSVISGAEHDLLYLVDVEVAITYLTEADADVLADCNAWIDDDCDCIALFV